MRSWTIETTGAISCGHQGKGKLTCSLAALLMPGDLLLKDCRAYAKTGMAEDDFHGPAKRYMVSEDAMRFRLMNLNVMAIG